MFYNPDTMNSGVHEVKVPRFSWSTMFRRSTGTVLDADIYNPVGTIPVDFDPDPIHNGIGNMRWHRKQNSAY